MKSYFGYSNTYNDSEGKEYSGICFNIPDFSEYSDYFITYLVTEKTEYRPDKIAWEIYGNDDLSWIIDEVNNISHMSEYIQNKEIYYLPHAILTTIGVI